MDIADNLSKIAYLALNLLLLAGIYFYSAERTGKKKAFLIVLLTAVFPFNISYNDVYYTNKFIGILFILLIAIIYYLFFRILKADKFSWQHIIFFALLSLTIRLRAYFLIVVILLLTVIIIKWIKESRAKYMLYGLPIMIVGSAALFVLQPITLWHYLQLDKFGIPDLQLLINNFFIFPRPNAIIMILVIWLVFFNLLMMQSSKNAGTKKEIMYIVIPEIAITALYLIFFSNHNVLGVGLFIGVLPFIPLNIFYFFKYIDGLSKKGRNTIIAVYILFCLIFIFFVNKTLINLLSSTIF